MKETASYIKYSVVVPVFNTTRVLEELQHRIAQVFSENVKQSYEIIFVDDFSSNIETWPTIEELVEKNEYISAYRLAKNFGQHAALLCGFANSKGDYVITMDDDLQHAPEDIPAMILLQQHDVVMGQFTDKKHTLARNLASKIKAYFDGLISDKPKGLRITSFCLFHKETTEKMLDMVHTPKQLFSTLIFQVTRDVVGVQVNHCPRKEGKSGYTFVSLFELFGRHLINRFFPHKIIGEQQKPYVIKQQIN